MSLKWYLFLKFSLEFVKKFESCGKTSKFSPKRCLFSIYIFYLNKEELIQQTCLKDIYKNNFFNATSHKTKKPKRKSKNIIQLHNYLF